MLTDDTWEYIMLRVPTISLLCGFLISLPAFCWNDFSHRLVDRVAYSGLESEIRSTVDELLGGGIQAFADASVWVDRIKVQRAETRSWHYVNIPLTAGEYDAGEIAREAIALSRNSTDSLRP